MSGQARAHAPSRRRVFAERYFGGRGITLNERFSAPQKPASSEDQEPQKLTLNQRFSSNQCVLCWGDGRQTVLICSFQHFLLPQRPQRQRELSAG